MREDNRDQDEEFSVRKLFSDLFDMIESVVFSIFLVLLIFTYVFRISDVSGPSMLPTLKNNDRVIVIPFFSEIKQNDIVIVDTPKLTDEKTGKPGKLIVKRVIATEGQTVDIDFETGIVTVDGAALNEQLYVPNPDGSEPELKADHFVNTLTTINMGAFDKYPVTVEKGKLFVLGDNRNESKDSKHSALGFIPEEEVVGKVVFRVYPFNKLGFIN